MQVHLRSRNLSRDYCGAEYELKDAFEMYGIHIQGLTERTFFGVETYEPRELLASAPSLPTSTLAVRCRLLGGPAIFIGLISRTFFGCTQYGHLRGNSKLGDIINHRNSLRIRFGLPCVKSIRIRIHQFFWSLVVADYWERLLGVL